MFLTSAGGLHTIYSLGHGLHGIVPDLTTPFIKFHSPRSNVVHLGLGSATTCHVIYRDT